MNTKSLNTTAPLTAMIASHIAVGNSQSPKPAKAPARPREVESPHLRYSREAPTHHPAPKDLLCRHLSLRPVEQTYITNRTSNQSQIQRAYRKSNDLLALRLDHLVNSGFNGTKHVAADLETKLQGLQAALVNRKTKLSDGVYFRPCKGMGGPAGLELRQKRDLVERVNDFNDYYDRNLGAQALSLLPSTSGTVGKSGRLSKSRERQSIIDQLEKVDRAREEIKLAENPRINRSQHCRQLEAHALPQILRDLVNNRGLPWTTQVAYQSLHHDIKVCSSILKALSERGNRTENLEALEAMVGKLTDALTVREKFLTDGEYFQPCTSRGGRPVWATDHKQRENMLDLVYQFAKERDRLVELHRSALDLDHDSSGDAFCDRQPGKLPGSWKEAKQVLSLIAQIKKIDRQIIANRAVSGAENPVQPASENAVTMGPTTTDALTTARRETPPNYNQTPKDVLCQRLSQSEVEQTFSHHRTSNNRAIQRAYPESYDSLGQRLDHLMNSGFHGARHEAVVLERQLQGLEAALVNRKAKLSDGIYFSPCRGNEGKKFAASELWQKRDLVERVNDFNDDFDRHLGALALILFPPGNRAVGQSNTLTRSRERQSIIDQLAKVNRARQEIKLAENSRINTNRHCFQLAETALSETLRDLVNTKGLPWTTQVAYQSLHHDMRVCSGILKALSKRRDDAGNLNALKVMLGRMTSALNIREKFLTDGEYFQPCLSSVGHPVWATDHTQRESMLALVYQLAEVRDDLVTQYGRDLALNDPSSVDAFCDRHPDQSPGSWQEARQAVALLAQIKKVEKQIQMVENPRVSGAGKEKPVRPVSEEAITTKAPGTRRTALPELTVFAKRPVETAHDVAVLYLKEMANAPRFDINALQDRIVHQVDSLIRSNSFHKDGFGTVDKFGWYDVASADWDSALQQKRWSHLTPVIQAKNNGSLNLDNYDYAIAVWDDTRGQVSIRGNAKHEKQDIFINGTTYTEKSMIQKFLKDDDLDNHCFYKEQVNSFNNPEYPQICYTNPVGENLKVFDEVIFHEFLHTKGLILHSGAFYCDNFLLGQCSEGRYNMFDGFSSARYYGTSLNAHDKHELNWLTDDDIVSLASNSGNHDVTLHHLNSEGDGKKAVKIDYQAFAGFDIWLEFRQPTELDYGLYNEAFDTVRRGLLIYKNNELLDATPATNALHNVDKNDVSITGNFNFEPLGLNINILKVDPIAQTIRFSINLSVPYPVRNPPSTRFSSPRCNASGDCMVYRGGSKTARYEAQFNDIGYGAQGGKHWNFDIIGLPAGISWTSTELSRHSINMPTNRYFREASTEITYSVGADVAPGGYGYLVRFIHPDDTSLYHDLRQYIEVL